MTWARHRPHLPACTSICEPPLFPATSQRQGPRQVSSSSPTAPASPSPSAAVGMKLPCTSRPLHDPCIWTSLHQAMHVPVTKLSMPDQLLWPRAPPSLHQSSEFLRASLEDIPCADLANLRVASHNKFRRQDTCTSGNHGASPLEPFPSVLKTPVCLPVSSINCVPTS